MMKSKFLLPHGFKTPGWIIFIPSFLFGVLALLMNWEPKSFFQPDFLNLKVFAMDASFIMQGKDRFTFEFFTDNIMDELICLGIIIGAIFIAFSRERIEDEFIAKIRLESLVWSTYVNYGILVLSVIFIYGFTFFDVMLLNMFTLLIFFLIRYNIVLYRLQKSPANEEQH